MLLTLYYSLKRCFLYNYRMKTRVSDMTTGIQNFVSLNSGNGGNLLTKISQFA